MLYWYEELMLDDGIKKSPYKVVSQIKRYYEGAPKSRIFSEKKTVFSNFFGKVIPWKEYYLITLSANEADIFDVLGTRQWVFVHYAKTDIYILGVYLSMDAALEAVTGLLADGYTKDASFDPRSAFGDKNRYLLTSDYCADNL